MNIVEIGITCALGQGKNEVLTSLFKNKDNADVSYANLFSGRTVPVAKIPFSLPELPSRYHRYNSRSNQLLSLVLDEIQPAVEKLKIEYSKNRIGVILGTSTSGMHEGALAFSHKQKTTQWPEGYNYCQQEIAGPSLFASCYLDIKGPAYTISTACSSGVKTILSAKRLIDAGICDAVICGGVDTLCAMTLNGFDALELLSKTICNPFSKNRDGISLGEGAAVLILTKKTDNPDHNEEYIELLGAGESSDAYHISAPDPTGEGARDAICLALEEAQLKSDQICYINLHGTASELSDAMESKVVNSLFGDKIPCSSTKPLTGHVLGAAGAIEAVFLWLSLSCEHNNTIPIPFHRWDGIKDPQLPPISLSIAKQNVSSINGQYALLSNSFAFGGSNVSVILGKKVKKG